MTITHEIKSITPKQALQILEAGAPNRNVSRNAVTRYAEAMASGRWTYNGQDIILDTEGRLIDGQHRLYAIIEAGVPVRIGIKHGVKAEAFDTIDSGRVRTGGDVLSTYGVTNPKDCSAVSRIGWQLDECGSLLSYPSRLDVTEYFKQWRPEIEAAVQMTRGLYRKRLVVPASAIGAVGFMATRHGVYSISYFEEFARPIMTGEDVSKGNPALTLREWALGQRIRNRGKIDSNTAIFITIRAWQKFVNGEDMASVQSPNTLAGYKSNFIPGQSGRIA